MSGPEAPDPINDFWAEARAHVGLGNLYPILADPTAPPPPAWSFGDTPEDADELLDRVLAGRATGTAAALAEYRTTGVPLPREGGLSVVLDGAGAPRALIRTTAVAIVPFGEVDAEQAAAEGEGDGTPTAWRRSHEERWRRRGLDVAPDAAVVTERFEVLYSR